MRWQSLAECQHLIDNKPISLKSEFLCNILESCLQILYICHFSAHFCYQTVLIPEYLQYTVQYIFVAQLYIFFNVRKTLLLIIQKLTHLPSDVQRSNVRCSMTHNIM